MLSIVSGAEKLDALNGIDIVRAVADADVRNAAAIATEETVSFSIRASVRGEGLLPLLPKLLGGVPPLLF